MNVPNASQTLPVCIVLRWEYYLAFTLTCARAAAEHGVVALTAAREALSAGRVRVPVTRFTVPALWTFCKKDIQCNSVPGFSHQSRFQDPIWSHKDVDSTHLVSFPLSSRIAAYP